MRRTCGWAVPRARPETIGSRIDVIAVSLTLMGSPPK
jgi:hypothetical protein